MAKLPSPLLALIVIVHLPHSTLMLDAAVKLSDFCVCEVHVCGCFVTNASLFLLGKYMFCVFLHSIYYRIVFLFSLILCFLIRVFV